MLTKNPLNYGHISTVTASDGEPKPIFKIVMGIMLEGADDPLSHGLALFDDFYARGGNAF